jgi:predicted ATP-binding protein involved in virulence
MRIDKINIKNFRKFNELDLSFKEGVNILIGDNASGKTSILEALRILLGAYFYEIDSKFTSSPSIDKAKDVQYIQDEYGKLKPNYPTQLSAEGILFDEGVKWNRDLNSQKGSTTISGLSNIKNIVLERTEVTLPIIAFYNLSRLEFQVKESALYKDYERFMAYENALDSNYYTSVFLNWFENEDRIFSLQKEDTYTLNIFTEALKSCLPNCKRVYYDSHLSSIVIEDYNNKITPFALLSDGYRLIISLVGDLVYRCAILNASLGDECLMKSPGVVIIDNIESNLYPSWQQNVVNDISNVFPKIQFVISTHSPLVLGGIKANVIHLWESSVADEGILTYGKNTDRILEDVMSVNSRPSEMKELFRELFSLLERDFDAADKLLIEIKCMINDSDPDILKAEILLKRRRLSKNREWST